MLIRLLVAAALLTAGSASAAPPVPMETYAQPARLISLPDGRKMNLFCLGKGSPTVVLDAGYGSGASTWAPIHATLAETTQVCAFDRPGYGFSDPGPLPRDTAAIVADERGMLKASGIRGPYVLVGHSMAGLDVRLYASRHSKEVAGAVLVDPSNPHQQKRLAEAGPNVSAIMDKQNALSRTCAEKAIAGAFKPGDSAFSICFPPPPKTLPEDLRTTMIARQGDPARLRNQLSEVESMPGADSEQIDASRKALGAMPWIVLTASKTALFPGASPDEQAALTRTWRQMHDEAAALSSRGENRQIEASHYVWREKPEAVIDAVNEVVAAVRTKAAAKP